MVMAFYVAGIYVVEYIWIVNKKNYMVALFGVVACCVALVSYSYGHIYLE